MASVGALRGLSGSTLPSKPGKAEYFGYFDCEVQLDSVIARPLEYITGKILVDTSKLIKCYGIRVQLDATMNLKFETKVDNRTSAHRKMESLLEGAPEPESGYYIASPVRVQLSGDESGEATYYCDLQKGSHILPFSLKIPGESLPSPFKCPYGSLQYKIVAYMRSGFCYVQIAEKTLKFRGYNNLNSDPEANGPLKSEASFQKSIFSSKKAITASLTAPRAGYVVGEEVIFQLNISNPKKYTLNTATVSLVRRITFNINGATKTTVSTLDKYEIDTITKEEAIIWSGKITIPKNSMPTYKAKQVYSVINNLQYQVSINEYPGPLKGQVEIIIGTTNEPTNRQMSLLQVENQYKSSSGRLSRSDSTYSRLSDNSMMSTISLPPNYSQLSSRAVSLMSLETLPPHYDDLG